MTARHPFDQQDEARIDDAPIGMSTTSAWLINDVAWADPSAPLYLTKNRCCAYESARASDDADDGAPSYATHVIDVDYGEVVDLVVTVGIGAPSSIVHSLHLHGYRFWVVATGPLPFPEGGVDAASSSTSTTRCWQTRCPSPSAGTTCSALSLTTPAGGTCTATCSSTWRRACSSRSTSRRTASLSRRRHTMTARRAGQVSSTPCARRSTSGARRARARPGTRARRLRGPRDRRPQSTVIARGVAGACFGCWTAAAAAPARI